jgi:hypothetical protein
LMKHMIRGKKDELSTKGLVRSRNYLETVNG